MESNESYDAFRALCIFVMEDNISGTIFSF